MNVAGKGSAEVSSMEAYRPGHWIWEQPEHVLPLCDGSRLLGPVWANSKGLRYRFRLFGGVSDGC